MPDDRQRGSGPHPMVVRRRRGENLPSGTRYVGRPTIFGNHFQIGRDGTRDEVVAKYRDWLMAPERAGLRDTIKRELRGLDLACWCAPEPCHADVLLEVANA